MINKKPPDWRVTSCRRVWNVLSGAALCEGQIFAITPVSYDNSTSPGQTGTFSRGWGSDCVGMREGVKYIEFGGGESLLCPTDRFALVRKFGRIDKRSVIGRLGMLIAGQHILSMGSFRGASRLFARNIFRPLDLGGDGPASGPDSAQGYCILAISWTASLSKSI